MKKIFLHFSLLFLSTISSANAFNSCDGTYSVSSDKNNTLTLKNKNKIVKHINLDHAINGILFSIDNSTLIAYGTHKKINQRNPQSTGLTVLLIKPNVVIAKRVQYGSGIYEVGFSKDKRTIIVVTSYGVDLINRKNFKTEFHGPIYLLELEIEHCRKDQTTGATPQKQLKY